MRHRIGVVEVGGIGEVVDLESAVPACVDLGQFLADVAAVVMHHLDTCGLESCPQRRQWCRHRGGSDVRAAAAHDLALLGIGADDSHTPQRSGLQRQHLRRRVLQQHHALRHRRPHERDVGGVVSRHLGPRAVGEKGTRASHQFEHGAGASPTGTQQAGDPYPGYEHSFSSLPVIFTQREPVSCAEAASPIPAKWQFSK